MSITNFFETNSYLIFDGGMGSMLQKAGMQAGETPERWNITRAADVKAVHSAYVAAGADVVTTNTFGANSRKLPKDLTVEQVVLSAVKIARESGARIVAQDIGPIGALLEPLGTVSFEEAYELFKEQVVAGEKAGADIYIIETMTDLYEVKAALLAVKENSKQPVIASMSFQGDGRTFLGTTPEVAAYTLCSLGADAVGVNCSLGPKELYPIVSKICKVAVKPVIVQANAGLPVLKDGETIYNIAPSEYAEAIAEMLPLGINIIGGCCGTTPDYIREVKKLTEGKCPCRREVAEKTALTSARVMADAGKGVLVVGERINPTGKKKLKEALKEGSFEIVVEEAISQEECGADVLECNCGLPGIDEKDILVKAVKQIQAVSSLPVQIDSTDAEALEAAVRIYNGIPAINSVNGKRESMETIFPIAAKYGAIVICLTLDENGIPEKAEDRLDIAERIMRKASEYGIPKEKLVFDSLTMTVATEQKSARETLKSVRLIKEQLGCRTMLGVSNISFGLPDRPVVNAAFLAEALAMGLDMPILNPKSKGYMDVIDSHRVFEVEDENAVNFIEKHKDRTNADTQASANTSNTANAQLQKEEGEDLVSRMKKVILSGRKNESPELTKKLLAEMEALEVINKVLIPALDEVSVRFEKGTMFLPQLIASAETVKAGFNIIKERQLSSAEATSTNAADEKQLIVLATVKGDIHDIGKNIVKMLLENYGFEVLDLGKDVEPEIIVEECRRTGAKLLGLSALMTTTAKYMAETVAAVHEAGLDTKIVVGGAVITADYAKEIGADYYSADAAETAKIATKLFER